MLLPRWRRTAGGCAAKEAPHDRFVDRGRRRRRPDGRRGGLRARAARDGAGTQPQRPRAETAHHRQGALQRHQRQRCARVFALCAAQRAVFVFQPLRVPAVGGDGTVRKPRRAAQDRARPPRVPPKRPCGRHPRCAAPLRAGRAVCARLRPGTAAARRRLPGRCHCPRPDAARGRHARRHRRHQLPGHRQRRQRLQARPPGRAYHRAAAAQFVQPHQPRPGLPPHDGPFAAQRAPDAAVRRQAAVQRAGRGAVHPLWSFGAAGALGQHLHRGPVPPPLRLRV